MIDSIKMAARVVALVGGFAAIVAIFALIRVPDINFDGIQSAVSSGLALLNHWIPGFSIFWAFARALIIASIALFGLTWVIIGVKWALKVSEG